MFTTLKIKWYPNSYANTYVSEQRSMKVIDDFYFYVYFLMIIMFVFKKSFKISTCIVIET